MKWFIAFVFVTFIALFIGAIYPVDKPNKPVYCVKVIFKMIESKI